MGVLNEKKCKALGDFAFFNLLYSFSLIDFGICKVFD